VACFCSFRKAPVGDPFDGGSAYFISSSSNGWQRMGWDLNQVSDDIPFQVLLVPAP
jgi:hypothetical protein